MAVGFQLINFGSPTEFLRLPFVPSETNWTANSDWAQFLPPGVSAGFMQFIQGNNRELAVELFLNDYGARSEDSIFAYYTDETGTPRELSGCAGALEWLEIMRSSRVTVDGVYIPPPVLVVYNAYSDMGTFVIRGMTPRIVYRAPRSRMSYPGQPLRAYVRLALVETGTTPNTSRRVGGW